MIDEILTRHEAAALLKISTRTLDNWIALGAIPSMSLPGRSVRIRRADLDSILTSRRDGSVTA